MVSASAIALKTGATWACRRQRRRTAAVVERNLGWMATKNRQKAYPGFRSFAGEVLKPGTLGIALQVEHLVEPQGAVRMFVEFHALPEQEPVDPHQ